MLASDNGVGMEGSDSSGTGQNMYKVFTAKKWDLDKVAVKQEGHQRRRLN